MVRVVDSPRKLAGKVIEVSAFTLVEAEHQITQSHYPCTPPVDTHLTEGSACSSVRLYCSTIRTYAHRHYDMTLVLTTAAIGPSVGARLNIKVQTTHCIRR